MRSQNKRTMKFSSSPIFHYIFRNSGLYASAFFALLKIHPTFINLLNLFLGAISVILVLIDTNNFKTAITLFLIAEFLDLTDGNLARYYNISSFWGRYLDGMVDILNYGFLMIVFFIFCLNNYSDNFIIIISTFAILASPIYHFMYDKYSSLARWSNYVNNTKVNPYIRMKVGKRTNFTLIDIEFLLLFMIFLINDNLKLYYLIYAYLLIHIIKMIFNLTIHTYHARKYLISGINPKRNN